MADMRQLIPVHQVIGYILGTCFVMVPLFAYRDATALFGEPALVHLAMLTGFGGAASAAALARCGDRVLALLPGMVGGVGSAFAWHYMLHSAPGSGIGSAKLQITIVLGAGALPGLGLFWFMRLVRRLTKGQQQVQEAASSPSAEPHP